jgi:hypothetical protein
MNKKNCIVYGNCQTEFIKLFLRQIPEFDRDYTIKHIECHILSIDDIPELESTIAQTNLFIYQPVSDDYKNVPQLSTNYLKGLLPLNSIAISIPSAYFSGYNFEMFKLKTVNDVPISKPFPLHDKNIIQLFHEGKSVDETVKAITNENFYSEDFVKQNLESTIAELQKREQDLDIKISGFIVNNYHKARLFHTINHPSAIIIAYEVQQILKILKINVHKKAILQLCNQQVLDYFAFPIYSSVAKHLGLQFNYSPNYAFRELNLTVYQAVEKIYQFYLSEPDIVIHNLEKLTGNKMQSIPSSEQNKIKLNHAICKQNSEQDFIEVCRSLNDYDFLKNLYLRYLYRELDSTGEKNYTTQMKQGVSREQILQRVKSTKIHKYAQQLAESAANLEVISIHIPKTAGTAFNNILCELYGKRNCLGDSNYSLKEIVDKNLLDLNTKAIFGHIPAKKYYYYLPYLPELKLITWLREPIQRLISWYCYCISMPPESFAGGFQTTVNRDKPSFMEFAGMPEARNAISRQLQGVNLSDFYFIGFQDSFEADILSLSKTLNWSKPIIKPANKNKYSKYEGFVAEILSDAGNVARLHNLNADDLNLYHEALKIRDKQNQSVGISQ